MWPWNLMVDLEKQKSTSSMLLQALCIILAHFIHYTKLWALSQTPRWNQTVTVRKRSICVKIGDYLSRVTLKFDGWPWKTIRNLFYATLSVVDNFKAICELKLKLQPGNAQCGSKSAIFFSCDLEMWQMTLKNNRAPLLCCFKLCASFHSYWWIKTGVTVRKRPIRVKIDDYLSRVTLKFDGWPWKTIGNLS